MPLRPTAARLLTAVGLFFWPLLSAAESFCSDWTASPSAGSTSSHWRESDESGKQLVTEVGRLSSAGVLLSTRCGGRVWTGTFQQSQGDRSYSGVTNNGTSAQTTSRIRQQSLGLGIDTPLGSGWMWNVQLGQRHIERSILSTAQASGYDEQFRYWVTQTGLSFETPRYGGWRGMARGAVGYLPRGRMQVALPGSDPARLRLGEGYAVDWGLGLMYTTNDGQGAWNWALEWSSRTEVISKGAETPVFRGIQLVGLASQPETRQRHTQVTLQAQYRFH